MRILLRIMIEDFKTYRINFLVDRFIASLIGSLMRIKLLGRRRQWFLDKGEDCLSERSERVPQPQKPSASAAVKKAPMRRALWFFG